MERMRGEFEGRGGGYGKYQGLAVSEIKVLFETCVEDPTMRSISAILRITREQLESRGQLGVYPVLNVIALGILVLSVGLRLAGPKVLEEWSTKAALGSGTSALLLFLSTWPTRHVRKENLKQELAICKLASESIGQILEKGPVLKPLSYEQSMTVKIIMKKLKDKETLRPLTSRSHS